MERGGGGGGGAFLVHFFFFQHPRVGSVEDSPVRSLTFRLHGFHSCTYIVKEETGDWYRAQLLSGTVCQSSKFLSSKFTSLEVL